MADFGKLGRALTLAGALVATPALAEDRVSPSLQLAAATNGQVTDCVAFVQGQRDLAQANGIPMSRGDQRVLLLNCQNNELDGIIAEQQRILVALNEQIAHLQVRVDAQGRILGENNQVIAFIVAINGQWVIQRQLETETVRLDADTERMLDEAERILQSLVSGFLKVRR